MNIEEYDEEDMNDDEEEDVCPHGNTWGSGCNDCAIAADIEAQS